MSNLSITSVDVNTFPEFDTHKRVLRIEDSASGLLAFISIHNTNRGPAIGGTRYWHYQKEEDALRDSLRLSRAMTYKCAIAEVSFGGAKGVILAPKDGEGDKDAILTAYAKALAELGEPFYTGEDVGLNEHDIQILEQHSNTIVGRPKVGGLPARWAALSVFYAMEGALAMQTGSASFEGKKIAIKGLGGVGIDLCALLEKTGAKLIGADIVPERIERALKNHPTIEIVDSAIIHTIESDIYSPCAMGNEFNKDTIPNLKTKIICGAANNQLTTQEDGQALFEAGILYVPDYVANAGGLISVADELHPLGYSQERVESDIKRIRNTVEKIIETSIRDSIPTGEVADALAEERFQKTYD
ncbi:MAG: leucine dehydrogenase [Parcubacteria group bacterium Greene0714_7]|nr:MAG: leucine dehydrogenase [Parcubacteria group bacterium Greene0714_7]